MRTQLYKLFHQPLRFIVMASLLILTPYALADSYLADLEAEANSTDVQEEEGIKETWSHKKQGLSDSLSKNLTHDKFEESLRDNYYGSFIFYKKLSKWHKKKVYETYQNTNDIEKIRTEIKTRMTK
ncbi:MAG: hypothetical protein ABFS08_12040 [Pseudomonadota bacterium]